MVESEPFRGPSQWLTFRLALTGGFQRGLQRAGYSLAQVQGATVHSWKVRISTAEPINEVVQLTSSADEADLALQVLDGPDELISRSPRESSENQEELWAATEPSMPETVESQDERDVTGIHLSQNRHPTRSPPGYFEEMLRPDPMDSRASVALD